MYSYVFINWYICICFGFRKELEDIIRLVTQQNNGTLTGLPVDEIFARVEKLNEERDLQRNCITIYLYLMNCFSSYN